MEFDEKDVEVIASWVEEGLKETFVNPMCWKEDDETQVQVQEHHPLEHPVPSVIVKKPLKKTNKGTVLETDEDGVWWGIEKFCGRRNDGNGNIHYLIKWENWSNGCTWQSSGDLTHAALQEAETLEAPCTMCAEIPLVRHVCWEDRDVDGNYVDDDDESSISSDGFGAFLSDDDDDDNDGSDGDDDSLSGDDSLAGDDSEHASTGTPSPEKKPRKAHRKKAIPAKYAHKTGKGKKKRSRGNQRVGRNPAKELADKNKVTWSIDGGELEKTDYDYCIEEKPKSLDTLAKVLFPGRIIEFKIDSKSKIDTKMTPTETGHPFSGYEFELLCVRQPKKEKSQQREKQDFKFNLGQQKKVGAYYVAVLGPGVPPISLRNELEKLANFASLAPRKIASRLELFLTDSKLLGRKYQKHWICDISPDILTEFNEVSCPLTLGCGFIPSKLAKDLYGGSGQGRKYYAFQVRILSPLYGFFKGMLISHPSIATIYLPDSMKKVGPSLHDDFKNRAVINFKATFPSKKCHELVKAWQNNGKIVSGEPIPQGVELYLEEVLGVKKETLRHYNRMSKKDQRKQHHASLVGCADPTNEIPDEMIFLSGFDHMPDFNSKYSFITRNPCVSKDDGRKICVLQTKPLQMSEEKWQFLKNLPFGIVIFPNSKTLELPPLIANGDLDGDKYFICWDKRIMNEVRCLPLSNKKTIRKKNKDDEKVPDGTSWLQCGQRLQADVKARNKILKLTGALHSEWKKEPASEKGQAFAEAYKASLDIPKHGGKIQLSKQYWKNIDNSLHENFEDID